MAINREYIPILTDTKPIIWANVTFSFISRHPRNIDMLINEYCTNKQVRFHKKIDLSVFIYDNIRVNEASSKLAARELTAL